jgi:hypothetical protein
MKIKNFIQFINEAASSITNQAIKSYYSSGVKNGFLQVPDKAKANKKKKEYEYWTQFPHSSENYFYSEGQAIPKTVKKYDPYSGKEQMVTAEQQIRNYLFILNKQGIIEEYVNNMREIREEVGITNASLFDIYVTTSGTGTPEQNNNKAKDRAEWVRETLIKLLQEITFTDSEGKNDLYPDRIKKLTSATAREIVMNGRIAYIQNFNDPSFIFPDPEKNLQPDRLLSIVSYNWVLSQTEPIVIKPQQNDSIGLSVQTVYNGIRGVGTNSSLIMSGLLSLKNREDFLEFFDKFKKLTGEDFFLSINGENSFGDDNKLILDINNYLNSIGYNSKTEDVGFIRTVLQLIP